MRIVPRKTDAFLPFDLSPRVWLTLAIALSGGGSPSAQPALPPDVDAAIRKDFVMEGAETRFLQGTIDLNGDARPEIVVHVVGPMACGTGGCPTLVFTPQGTGYRLVTTLSVSRPPIRASRASTHGWRNLIVHVSGGGARGHDAELSFDGRSYPANPSVTGRQVKPAGPGGDVIIKEFGSFQDATPLPPR